MRVITKHCETSQKQSIQTTSSARVAWKYILDAFSDKSKVKVLLPSYIGFSEREGSGIFDPITELECEYDFYLLNSQLHADISDIEEMIRRFKPDVLLMVHYFGFIQPELDLARSICDKNNIILVEDCAHVPGLNRQKSKHGSVGDYSFYSVHKAICSSDGGLLRQNNLHAPSIDIKPLDHCNRQTLNEILWFDQSHACQIRKNNYQLYLSHFEKEKNVEILHEYIGNDIPQSFPLLVKNGLREKLYFELLERKCPTTALYYRLIEPLYIDKYHISQSVSNSILNLPLHQEIDSNQIAFIAGQVKLCLEKLSNE